VLKKSALLLLDESELPLDLFGGETRALIAVGQRATQCTQFDGELGESGALLAVLSHLKSALFVELCTTHHCRILSRHCAVLIRLVVVCIPVLLGDAKETIGRTKDTGCEHGRHHSTLEERWFLSKDRHLYRCRRSSIVVWR